MMGFTQIREASKMTETPSMKDTIAVRVILPSGVKELVGPRDWVAEEVVRLIQLEADIGGSFVEEVPSATNSYRTTQLGGK
jgi:hypothetical protein